MRLHHYSIHTERTYMDWIKRQVQFHRMKTREDLIDGERKIEAFLTHVAMDGQVARATYDGLAGRPHTSTASGEDRFHFPNAVTQPSSDPITMMPLAMAGEDLMGLPIS